MHGLLEASCLWLCWILQRGESIWRNTGPSRFGRPMCCPVWMFFHHRTRRDGCCNGLLVADRNYDTNSWPAHRGRSGWYQDSLYMYHVRSRNATSPQVVNLSHQSQPRLSCLSRAHVCQKTHETQSKASHLVQYNRPRICNPGSIWAWTRPDLLWIQHRIYPATFYETLEQLHRHDVFHCLTPLSVSL